MPIYDYDCAACGRRFEAVHGVHADPPASCPLCGEGPIKKAFAPPTIVFKGSGWAKRDRRSTAAKASSSADDSPSATPDGGGTPKEGGGDGDAKPAPAAPASSPKASTGSSASPD